MRRRLLAAFDRFMGGDVPVARWGDTPDLDEALARHPAGKSLRASDAPAA